MALYFPAPKQAMSKSVRIDCFEVHELKLVLKDATQHEMKHQEILSVSPDLMVAPVRECFMKNDESFSINDLQLIC